MYVIYPYYNEVWWNIVLFELITAASSYSIILWFDRTCFSSNYTSEVQNLDNQMLVNDFDFIFNKNLMSSTLVKCFVWFQVRVSVVRAVLQPPAASVEHLSAGTSRHEGQTGPDHRQFDKNCLWPTKFQIVDIHQISKLTHRSPSTTKVPYANS